MAAISALLLTSALPAEAGGRPGSQRVGGIGSSGKGGHYVGGYASPGGGVAPEQTCWTAGAVLGPGAYGTAVGLPICGDGRWFTEFASLTKTLETRDTASSSWTLSGVVRGGDVKDPSSLDGVPVTLKYQPAAGGTWVEKTAATTAVGNQHGVVTFTGVNVTTLNTYLLQFAGTTKVYSATSSYGSFGFTPPPPPPVLPQRVITLTANATNQALLGGFWRAAPGAPCQVTVTVGNALSAAAGSKYSLYILNPDGTNGTLLDIKTQSSGSNIVSFQGVRTTTAQRLRVVHPEQVAGGFQVKAASSEVIAMSADNTCRVER